MEIERLITRLGRPQDVVDVVLDTDTYNEVDDQFALAYLLRSPERARVRAIYAAPFLNDKSTSPQDGMLKSHAEIQRILDLCGRRDMLPHVYQGSATFLNDEKTPVPSQAGDDLIRLARAQPMDRPLYVLAIGAITNVASALLLAPDIVEKIVIVWLGGHALHWPHTREFNLFQDVAAARVVFGSGAPVVQLPCEGVVTHLATSGPEMARWMKGKNALCDYLYEITRHEEEDLAGKAVWSRVIWDVSAVAWLLSGDFVQDVLVHSPIPTHDGHYALDPSRHFIRYVYRVNRDLIFADLFQKLGSDSCPAGDGGDD